MSQAEQEPLLDDEKQEIMWVDYLKQFRDDVYPLFQQSGFSLPEAFSCWQMNRVNNSIHKLIEYFEEEDGEDEKDGY